MAGKRIVFVGAGAIGGYTGAHMTRAGYDVTLIDPWPAHIEAIRANGLEVTGVAPEHAVTVKPKTMHLTEVQNLAKQAPVDIAFVSVKSYDTEWATAMIRQYLAPDGYVVSLQNCINEPRVASVVGWDKTVGCIAALLAAELYEPGKVRRTAGGDDVHSVYRVGEVHGRKTDRLKELAEMIASVDTVTPTTNLWGERWSKLCVNGMRNGISAATGLGGIARDRHEGLRRFSIKVGGEAVRVGQALGYVLEHIGNLEPNLLARAGEGDAGSLEQVEALLAAGSNARSRSELQRPSMAQDMAKGRRTEIDFINGLIVAEGQKLGVTVDNNQRLTETVKRVERGDVPARPENLA